MVTTSGPAVATRDLAIGIVRVSEQGERDDDSFHSPEQQAERIRSACEQKGLTLLRIEEPEIDVSGGLPLGRRPGLAAAVRAIERGEAGVVVAAYFDRLFRSLATQEECVRRVEAAGGRVVALDTGDITGASAGQWLSGTLLGAVSEYVSRSARERSTAGQERAIAAGKVPWPRVTTGYRRNDDGTWRVEPAEAELVARAFAMRRGGATIERVRALLRENGIQISYHGTMTLLASRTVLGEVNFRGWVNPAAFPAIVDRDVFEAVQKMVVPRGPQPRSDRLLARLGVLRCASCGARMVVATSNMSQYYIYRCPPTGDCAARASVPALTVEREVAQAVRAALADVEGRASAQAEARQAEVALAAAQAALDSAVRTLAGAGVLDEPAALERLSQLREARDAARAHLDRIDLGPELTVSAADDWERLTLDERRALVRIVVRRVEVTKGRGPGRIAIRLFGQQPPGGSVQDPPRGGDHALR
jgi:DNA invertase Pin-like site-specific DNA recombinase